MKNKFDTELVKANVFKKKEDVETAAQEKKNERVAPVRKYSKVLEELNDEPTYGVNVQIPLSYYRRMRDYKDLHKGESFQSMVFDAVIHWVEENA